MRWDHEYGRGDVVEPRKGPHSRFWIGVFVVVAALSLGFHRNLFAMIARRAAPRRQGGQAARRAVDNTLVHFVTLVLDDVQNVWRRSFLTLGVPYVRANLVLFSDGERAVCGAAHAGPFYCPADQGVYLDLGYFSTLRARFHAPGDFALAYVIAHEVGHHVQRQLGIEARVQALLERNPSGRSRLREGLELQADCFAGVWASATEQRDILESSELDEALAAAAAVGDETIGRGAGRGVNLETWTHATAVQRATWFRRGWSTGDPRQCSTLDELGVN